MGRNILIQIGDRFGRLTVEKESEPHYYPSGEKRRSFECRCDCGSHTKVLISRLRSGHTQSCGCILPEIVAKRNKNTSKHNETGSRLYSIWHSMKNRVHNKNDAAFVNYGGRGITMCDAWMDYTVFRDWALSNGYSDDLSIDRINNNEGYYPSNCRWSTCLEQSRNKRNNRHVSAFGETKCLSAWAGDPRCRVVSSTLKARIIRYLWDPEIAISTPSTIDRSKKIPK